MTFTSVELEFFRQWLTSIPEEMGVVLRKSAFSANIKERRDYSCALYDAQARTLAMGDHMPVHLGAMPLSVHAALAAFPLEPGDVAMVNDPFQGGTHLPDLTAVAPVYVNGSSKPEFYVACRAHHSDVGGMSPGSMPLAQEIYQEGLRLPPVKIQKRGKIDRDLLQVILANVRTPEEREGDLEAQLACLQRGAARIQELIAKQGRARVQAAGTALVDYSERMMRAELRRLPPGRYTFEDQLDPLDGEPLFIRVAVTLTHDGIEIDFTGTSPQVRGPVNANRAVTLSAVFYVLRCLLSEEVPATEGLMRPARVITPEGTLVNAQLPAAMAAGNVETSQRITDVLLGALAQAAPDRIPAASSGTMNNLSFGGAWPGTRRRFAWYETIAGGMGASAQGPGLSGVQTHMTNSRNTPVEAFEHAYPVRLIEYRIRRGSGGAGKHRGGDGIVREIEFLAGADVTLLADRRETAPYGLQGGAAGTAGSAFLRKRGANALKQDSSAALQTKKSPRVQVRELPGRVTFRVEPGDRVRVETPGGGGFGLE